MTQTSQDVERITREIVGVSSCNAARDVFLRQSALPEDCSPFAHLSIQSQIFDLLMSSVRDGLLQAGFRPDEEALAHFQGAAETLFSEEYMRLCRGGAHGRRGCA